MPANPAPARGAGDYRIQYRHSPTHLTATLHRRAATGALVEVGRERVSYPLVQETLSRTEGIPGPEELGWVDDPEELGAIGKKIKKFAKKVAKSKLGKIVKSVGKVATAFVPGGQALTMGIKATKGAVKLGKKVAARKRIAKPAPPPPPVYEYDEYSDEYAAAEEVGAVAKKKAPAKKAAPKKAAPKKAPAAKKAAPKKAAPKKAPAAKKAPAPKKAAPKKAPAKAPKKAAPAKAKTAAKPKKKAAAAPSSSARAGVPSKSGKPKASPKPKSTPPKPADARVRAQAIQAQGGAAATLLRAASSAPTAEAAAEAQQLAQLAAEIEDDAPELAAALAELPDVEPGERDLMNSRAAEAARVLASKPPEERAEAAQKIEKRLDAYKVITPTGDTVWIPIEAVEAG